MSGILWLGGGCIVLLLLAGFLAPIVLKSRKATDRTEAINNLKQIHLSLQDFDASYGRYPDATTISQVKADTGTALTLGGSSSNRFFRQLLATGLKSEKPFYAKRVGGKRPDDLFADDAHALGPGECGFGYIVGLSSTSDPETPVVVTPLIPGTRLFDAKIHSGKSVVLRVDGAAHVLTIDPGGHTILNGMDLFDPRQPFWHGKTPDLRWPE
jgi:type II secretory pathway pseudopilin PulG